MPIHFAIRTFEDLENLSMVCHLGIHDIGRIIFYLKSPYISMITHITQRLLTIPTRNFGVTLFKLCKILLHFPDQSVYYWLLDRKLFKCQ